eukprot:scaffold158887_cov24-Prasinocladus_malaysianus.AAC.1
MVRYATHTGHCLPDLVYLLYEYGVPVPVAATLSGTTVRVRVETRRRPGRKHQRCCDLPATPTLPAAASEGC